jgi:nucleoside-diphosphate-sugar epimerase
MTERELDALLASPSAKLTDDMRKLDGDLMILGAGGKMGPTLALLAQNALRDAGNQSRVIAVSRFTDPYSIELLRSEGVQTISANLLNPGTLDSLPDVPNIIYMAGRKFGTGEDSPATWEMNAALPTLCVRRFPKARWVVFSSGNVYAQSRLNSGGSTEEDAPLPNGEYGMSVLARERIFERAAQSGTQVLLYRLNYAGDLRYGVLCDIARKVMAGEPVSLAMSVFNCVWQGWANEVALRSLLHAGSPAVKLNVTGPETVSVEWAAKFFGRSFGKAPKFEGVPGDKALFSDSAECVARFGYPGIGLLEMMRMQAEWLTSGGRLLDKLTHFEEKKGNY